VVFSEPITDFDDAADVTVTGTAGATTTNITGGPTTYNVAVSGMTGDGTVIASIPADAATDGVNLNAASTSGDNSVLYDTVAPSVTINQASGQDDPTNVSPVNFTVTFSEAVTDFDDVSDVTLSGTAGATTAFITGGPTTYNVSVSGMTSDGTVIADIPTGASLDAALQPNGTSTSTDNSVTYDATQPTVTINQAAGQSDPASSSLINFTVVFSEPVTDFDDAADVNLSGTAAATTTLITGGPTTYNVAISGMTGDGTVIASIPASVATDGANLNTASVSTDNTVTFIADTTPPNVSSVNRADPSPTSAAGVNFTVTFSESVTGVDLSDFTLITTGVSGATVSNVSGSGDTYTVTVNTGTGNGTIRLDVPNGASIEDENNNALTNLPFNTGETYTVNKIPTAPETATLISPDGDIGTDFNPTYTWNEVAGVTLYYLWVNGPSGNVIKQWYTSAQANCDGTTCSVTPSTSLSAGSYIWWIQTLNSAGYSPWSDGMSFTISPPGVATLVSPSGSTTNTTPTYLWNEVNGATWYYLWVNGPSGTVIQQWYTSAQANCNGTTCSVTPSTTINSGAHTWWIQTWNSAGYGPWSSGMNFTPTTPGKATLVSPTGSIGSTTPTYTWNEVSGSTWYYLWVNGPSGNVIKQWYTSAQANCNGSTCSVTPSTALSAGAHTWWIQTWNTEGTGPWSDGMNFSVTLPALPGKATLVSPSGSSGNNAPTYTWNEVSGATWYYLWVNGPSGTVIQQWYTSAQANCNGTTCSVTSSTVLGAGSHSWWIQTWNSAGYGPWSDRMDFSVP
jgi:hypothetical protein